jgi:hypothetical protein
LRQSLPPKFLFANALLFLLYLFCNPYRYCRKFLQNKGEENIYAYGETPLETLDLIAENCPVKPIDTWLDLGSGRGQGTIYITAQRRCKGLGIDQIERFVRRANWTARLTGLPATFLTLDILDAPFDQATVVYLYGTAWPDATLSLLEEKMQKLPKGARIISISAPLKTFPLLKTFPVSFPWGDTDAFLHIAG